MFYYVLTSQKKHHECRTLQEAETLAEKLVLAGVHGVGVLVTSTRPVWSALPAWSTS